LPAGHDLNSVELAKRFSSSRTPVREALMLLEKQELVEIPPRRRPRVAGVSPKEVKHIYEARAALQAFAYELIAANANEEEITALRVLLDEMGAAATACDVDQYFWANVAFHMKAAEACGNPVVTRILESQNLRTLQLRHTSLSLPHRIEQSLADHRR